MRVFGVGLVVLLVFGVFEQWPRRLPEMAGALGAAGGRRGRGGAAVTVFVPLPMGAPPAGRSGRSGRTPEAAESFHDASPFPGMLVAPWVALTALLRQREAKVEKQAIDFELERSEMARQALDARMRLLTAQAQPHFLFNTLANVQALVEAGSPRAPQTAAKPDRLPARRRAAPGWLGQHAGPGAGAGARLPGADANAHARPAGFCPAHRAGRCAPAALPADDPADPGGECRSTWHRPERRGRPHRCPCRALETAAAACAWSIPAWACRPPAAAWAPA